MMKQSSQPGGLVLTTDCHGSGGAMPCFGKSRDWAEIVLKFLQDKNRTVIPADKI